jgi:hypothetical protein
MPQESDHSSEKDEFIEGPSALDPDFSKKTNLKANKYVTHILQNLKVAMIAYNHKYTLAEFMQEE